jgi:hypothetical protein
VILLSSDITYTLQASMGETRLAWSSAVLELSNDIAYHFGQSGGESECNNSPTIIAQFLGLRSIKNALNFNICFKANRQAIAIDYPLT